jgi:cell division protein FtsN
MEKQKIIWVVLSVGIFVVVVLVVGVLLLKQRPGTTETTQTVSPLTDPGTRVYEYSPEKPAAPAPEQRPGEPETMKLSIGEGRETPLASPQKPVSPRAYTATLPAPQVPPEKPKLVPQVPLEGPRLVQVPPEEPKLPVPAAKPGQAARAPETPKAAEIARAPKAAPDKKKVPAPRLPAPRALRTAEYWIQTGSYKSQSRAEDLAKLLGEKGLAGRVSSYASKRETYFRVRVGPYTNRLEAEKFLGIVKQIQGLEASYISSVAGTRTVN